MTRFQVAILGLLLVPPLSAATQQPTPTQRFAERYAELVANRRRLSDSGRLHELFRINWEYQVTEFPEFATYVGHPGQDHRWTDHSLQAIERRKTELREPVAVIKSIRRERLPPTDPLNYHFFPPGPAPQNQAG